MPESHDSVLPWYVVYTQLSKELQVLSLVELRLNLPVYLPEVYQKYHNQIQLRPLFPRYLFVQQTDSRAGWVELNRMPGIIRVVEFGGEPLPLRNEVVQAIRAEVERLNARGGLPAAHYSEGEVIRLRSGPLAGMDAVFLKHLPAADRAVVLLHFLGQENQVTINLSDIEPSPKRRRGTRGRGRKIHYKEKQK
jgi:transcriptional antiterminator RfaH